MRPTLLLVMSLSSGCVIGSDRYIKPRDLSQSWLVDRARILGIRAEPPEAVAGELVTFEALIPNPDADPNDDGSILWLACPPDPNNPGGIGFGCELDFSAIDVESMDFSALADAGVIGFDPLLPPSYVVPGGLLDGLDNERDRREGVNVTVQVTALTPSALETPPEDIDFNEIEIGYKRLVVSEATTPNQNPAIFEFVVDRFTVLPGTVVHVEPEQAYELGVILEENLVETYEYLTRDGVLEERREEPYAAWYTTDGEMLEPITLYPYTEASWRAPKKGGVSGLWYAVVRDRRGGMTWHVQEWITD
jgi:hypothetical protein